MVIGKPQSNPTLEWFLSHCHIHKYPAKSTLIHAGEKAETLYYIVKGTVAVLIKDDEGKEMILSYLNQGDFLGEMGMFEENENPSAPPGFARRLLRSGRDLLQEVPPADPGQPGHSDASLWPDGQAPATHQPESG